MGAFASYQAPSWSCAACVHHCQQSTACDSRKVHRHFAHPAKLVGVMIAPSESSDRYGHAARGELKVAGFHKTVHLKAFSAVQDFRAVTTGRSKIIYFLCPWRTRILKPTSKIGNMTFTSTTLQLSLNACHSVKIRGGPSPAPTCLCISLSLAAGTSLKEA
jgi:hypothetical protein